jgi:hypothetical protein
MAAGVIFDSHLFIYSRKLTPDFKEILRSSDQLLVMRDK